MTPPRPRTLDTVDLALIATLQDDGRASFTALAKSVGLSEGAVRQRVQRMLGEKTMRIVAVVEPETLELHREAMIGVTVDGDARQIAKRLAELPEAHEVVLTAGSFDILCEVACRNDQRLLALLADEIRAVDGVLGTETFVYLSRAKRSYEWGTAARS